MPKIFEIVPGLWQGSHPRPALPPEFKAVINVDYTEAEYPTDHLAEYHHFPIPDGPDPGLDWLDKVMRTAKKIREAGLPLYIHCQAGISRSVFVTAAVLMAEFKLDPEEAINTINAKTNQADPAPAFILCLRRLYDSWRYQ